MRSRTQLDSVCSLTSRGQVIAYGKHMAILLIVSLSSVSSTSIVRHDTCETDAQCLNGGFCLGVGTYAGSFKHCYCTEGYGGNRCERYCPLLCQNGGVCHPNNNGGDLLMREEASSYRDEDFVCKCLGYFTGKLCDIPYENCSDGSRCLNGGQCIDRATGSSSCLCQSDFFGNSCDVHVPVTPSKAQPTTLSSSHTKISPPPPTSQPTVNGGEKDSTSTNTEKDEQLIPDEANPEATTNVQTQAEHPKPVRKSPPPYGVSATVPHEKSNSNNKLVYSVSIGAFTFILTMTTGLLVWRRRRKRSVKSSPASTESEQLYLWHAPSADVSWKFVL